MKKARCLTLKKFLELRVGDVIAIDDKGNMLIDAGPGTQNEKGRFSIVMRANQKKGVEKT